MRQHLCPPASPLIVKCIVPCFFFSLPAHPLPVLLSTVFFFVFFLLTTTDLLNSNYVSGLLLSKALLLVRILLSLRQWLFFLLFLSVFFNHSLLFLHSSFYIHRHAHAVRTRNRRCLLRRSRFDSCAYAIPFRYVMSVNRIQYASIRRIDDS